MRLYLTRHGQTDLNKRELMQGHTDAPLNETGISQAKQAREYIKDVKFDCVYSSPLIRAKKTACILGDVNEDELITDERIIEVDFGDYELREYHNLGIKLTSYWLLPEIFPCPKSVESMESIIKRSHEFLQELEQKDYENVLIVCHGGILRPMFGYLLDKKKGYVWRPKPTNCEIRVFDSVDGKHSYVDSYKLEEKL